MGKLSQIMGAAALTVTAHTAQAQGIFDYCDASADARGDFDAAMAQMVEYNNREYQALHAIAAADGGQALLQPEFMEWRDEYNARTAGYERQFPEFLAKTERDYDILQLERMEPLCAAPVGAK